TSGTVTDMFLARFDASGTYKWARSFGNSNFVVGFAVAVDSGGHAIVGGAASWDVDLGCGNLPGVGQADVVLADFDPQGVCVWSKRFGTPWGNQQLVSLHVDAQDDVVFSVRGDIGLDFGGGPLDGCMYLSKFTRLGAHAWSKAFDGC